jgi:hypothetical protein
MKPFVFCFALLMLCTNLASAQRVAARGYGEADLDAVLRSTLSGQYTLVTEDRLISRADTVQGNVLVVRARLIVEGTVLGNVVGVDANMYFRPSAVVNGSVTNIAGGFYPSEQAELRSVENRPLAPYHVRESDGVLIIEGTNSRPALKLGGLFGLQNPEYNRVDGVRAEFGPTLLLPPFFALEPSLFASVGYATHRGDLITRAGIGFRRGRSNLIAGWENNITETNDRWIRSDLKNSLSYFWNAKDYRNYYEAERIYAEFSRTLERGARETRIWLRGQREDASPLVAGKPWTVLKADTVRPNPLIPESSITSVILGAESEWEGLTSAWQLSGWIESAGAELVDSDHAFNMYGLDGLFAMKAIANHTLEIEGNFRGPLPGTESLPEQRWTHIGGSGTLYTFPIAEFRGDRLVFVESEYTIPFSERLRLPILGLPRLRLMHNIGMAWTDIDDRRFEQNIGARIQFTMAHLRYVVDPRSGDSKFSVGVSFPSRSYPWEKQQRTPLTR